MVCSKFAGDGNPLLKIAPGTMLRVKFPTAPGQPDSVEDFDIANIANIVEPTKRTGVYEVLHSELGWMNMVLKILSSPDQKANTPATAENYMSEVNFSEELSGHVRKKNADFNLFLN